MKKTFSVTHPFIIAYLIVLCFAMTYQIKEMRLFIHLFPFAFLFHHFVCAHFFLQNSITVFRLLLRCYKILQNRPYLEEQICYKGHSPSKTHISITTHEGTYKNTAMCAEWGVTLRCCVGGFRRFEGPYCPLPSSSS